MTHGLRWWESHWWTTVWIEWRRWKLTKLIHSSLWWRKLVCHSRPLTESKLWRWVHTLWRRILATRWRWELSRWWIHSLRWWKTWLYFARSSCYSSILTLLNISYITILHRWCCSTRSKTRLLSSLNSSCFRWYWFTHLL